MDRLTKAQAEVLLNSKNEEDVTKALLYICFNFEDSVWVQNICLKLLDCENENICGLAITCIGHIARIHSTIDQAKVLPALKEKINDSRFAGRVADALDDINMFVKNTI